MTGIILALSVIVTAELMVRNGLTPLKTLAEAATGQLVIK